MILHPCDVLIRLPAQPLADLFLVNPALLQGAAHALGCLELEFLCCKAVHRGQGGNPQIFGEHELSGYMYLTKSNFTFSCSTPLKRLGRTMKKLMCKYLSEHGYDELAADDLLVRDLMA